MTTYALTPDAAIAHMRYLETGRIDSITRFIIRNDLSANLGWIGEDGDQRFVIVFADPDQAEVFKRDMLWAIQAVLPSG